MTMQCLERLLCLAGTEEEQHGDWEDGVEKSAKTYRGGHQHFPCNAFRFVVFGCQWEAEKRSIHHTEVKMLSEPAKGDKR
jgi:hypothetical protein